MTIIWSQKAGETFQRNIDYLKDNWTQNEVDKFINRVFQYFEVLIYNSGESEQICLINANSVYYFYLSKGNRAIKIAPIGSVKNIEFTNNSMLK